VTFVRSVFRPALAGILGLLLSAGMAHAEVPALQALVDAGTLPAMADRLPEDPRIITPIESIGTYGGDLNLALKRGDGTHLLRLVGYEGLFSWDLDWKEMLPNLASSYEVNADATEYTIHLRKGVKWSDGSPFSSADIAFAYNDLLKNPDWLGTRPNFINIPEETTIEVVDDWTFKVKLAKPNGLYIFELTNVEGTQLALFNKAYCSQFHPTYNANADADAKAAGLADWRALLEQKCPEIYGLQRWMDPARPTLEAWVVESPPDATAEFSIFTRNPYYFKVDTEGNQLPYLDRINFTISNEGPDMILRAMNGEVDFQDRNINALSQKPVYLENAEAGGFHLVDEIPSAMNTMVLMFNQEVSDPALREVFRQRDFRVAMSHAIDRQEIIDAIYVGVGQPFQAAPRPESKYYDEAFATQYLDYDPDKANALLDGIGLTARDGEGYRLMADGKRLGIMVETFDTARPDWADQLEIIKAQWVKVGVDLQVKIIDRNLVDEHREANLHQLQIWGGDGGLDVVANPVFYMVSSAESAWGVPWYYWLWNDPTSAGAAEPPEAVKKQKELYDQLFQTATTEGQDELMREILTIAKEEFYVIGVSLAPKGYAVVKNNVHNVPPEQPAAYSYPTPGPMQMAQIWKSE
jgi:peptide/nickel transport system substrate-binding protein